MNSFSGIVSGLIFWKKKQGLEFV